MSIKVMKQALEALESIGDQWGFTSKRTVPKRIEAITALRQAIEQAEQCQCPACKIKPHASDCSVHNEPAWPNGPCDCGAIEQAQKQEPFGYFRYDLRLDAWVQNRAGITGTPFYTSPPPRRPLTDEEIEDLYFDRFSMGELKAFARAIEAAHGIGEKA